MDTNSNDMKEQVVAEQQQQQQQQSPTQQSQQAQVQAQQDASPALIRRRSASDITIDLKRPFRFYWASDDHMYWTLLLDPSNTVRDITEGLKTKVPSGQNIYLYKRTKGKFGRTKDRRLSNEDKIWEIVDKRRENEKSDPTFVIKKKKASSLNVAVAKAAKHHSSSSNNDQHSDGGSPLSYSGEILNTNISTTNISTNNATNNNSNGSGLVGLSISTPPTTTPPALPFLSISPQQQRRSQEQQQLVASGLKSTMELNPPAITHSTDDDSSTKNASLKKLTIKTPPKSIKDIFSSSSPSTPNGSSSNLLAQQQQQQQQQSPNKNKNGSLAPPTATNSIVNSGSNSSNSLLSAALANNSNLMNGNGNSSNGNGSLGGSGGMGRPASPSPFGKKMTMNDSSKRNSNRLSMQQDNSKDVMRLMRFYFGEFNAMGGLTNNIDGGGRFFTLALAKETTARDVGISVEQKLQLPPNSISVFLVLPVQSNGSKIERMLGEEELIIDVKDTWEDPLQTFFVVKETYQKPLNKRLSKQIADSSQQHNVIPSEWRRSTDAISLRSPSDDSWKRRSIPIFLQVLPSSPHSKQANQSGGGVGPSPLSTEFNEYNNDDKYDDSDDDDSELDVSELMGWAHLIPTQDLEYIKRIGSGTYSKVYKGRYLDKYVAIKTLRGNMTPEQIQGFRKECDILSTIKSPHLISFYGSCIEDSQLSMVVEYCSRGTLHKVLNSPFDLDWEKCIRWMMQIVEGVHYLHMMNPPTVHRDLKTLNILLSTEFNAKLCDFGLTRTMTMTNVSTLGMLRGTMAYTAPEIYDGMLFNTRSDVYSLGVIMWELAQRIITGAYQRPFHDYPISMDIQIIIMTSKNKVRPKLHEACPEPIKNLICQCWDQDPTLRPNTTQIIAELNSIKKQYEENHDEWDNVRTKSPKPLTNTSPTATGATKSTSPTPAASVATTTTTTTPPTSTSTSTSSNNIVDNNNNSNCNNINCNNNVLDNNNNNNNTFVNQTPLTPVTPNNNTYVENNCIDNNQNNSFHNEAIASLNVSTPIVFKVIDENNYNNSNNDVKNQSPQQQPTLEQTQQSPTEQPQQPSEASSQDQSSLSSLSQIDVVISSVNVDHQQTLSS